MERMSNEEQAVLTKISSERPLHRMESTKIVLKCLGLDDPRTLPQSVALRPPMSVPGIVLKAPTKFFDGHRGNNHYVEAKNLLNWEIVFMPGEVVPRVDDLLMQEMRESGMNVNPPSISYIHNLDVHEIFKNAIITKKQLLFFVLQRKYKFHDFIKLCEQRYDILTQEIHLETAEKLMSKRDTRKGIVNKINMKLGGLNYRVDNEVLDSSLLIVGFSLSHSNGFGDSEYVCVGFASNALDHPHKFSGGFKYVERTKQVFKDVIFDVLLKSLKSASKNRKMKAQKVVIYFNGISDGQFATVNEVYSQICVDCFTSLRSNYRPHLTILASSKFHNERLFKTDQGRVENLEPGSIVDTAIVSPVYNEFYHVGAVAFQGTCKPTKYTVVYSSEAVDMEYLERLTNDLCHEHQIITSSISLPIPLHIASECSERGTRILKVDDQGPARNVDGRIDYEETNKMFGYDNKKLKQTRFNA